MTSIEIPTTYEDIRTGETVIVVPGERVLPGVQEMTARTGGVPFVVLPSGRPDGSPTR